MGLSMGEPSECIWVLADSETFCFLAGPVFFSLDCLFLAALAFISALVAAMC